jgi:hypothetical protein
MSERDEAQRKVIAWGNSEVKDVILGGYCHVHGSLVRAGLCSNSDCNAPKAVADHTPPHATGRRPEHTDRELVAIAHPASLISPGTIKQSTTNAADGII